MASYTLQTSGSWLLWAARVRHHDYPKKLWSRSTYSLAAACPSCSWLHIHTVALSIAATYVVVNMVTTYTKPNC